MIDTKGVDLTRAFVEGATKELENSLEDAASKCERIEGAILKANSPSCGCGKIYDGSFSHTVIDGDGIFAGELKKRGIIIANENNFKEIFTE